MHDKGPSPMKDPATVYAWLAEVDDSSKQIVVFQNLAKQVHEALNTNQLLRARPVLQRLQKFSETANDPFLFFEGCLILALVAHRMMQYRQAFTFFDRALQRIDGYQPHSAIARWMQGCTHFASLQATDGILAWHNSLNDFQYLALDPGVIPLEWVYRRSKQMRTAIEIEVSSLGGPSAAYTSAAAQSRTHQEGSILSSMPKPHQPTPTKKRESRPLTRSLTVYIPSISAGHLTPTQSHELQIDQLLINDQPFSILDIPGLSTPSVLRLNELSILYVKGDSMNRAGIQDGDYVLIRHQQEAVNNDIVAAEIIGDEYEATLKRYRVDQNRKRVILQPESDNPNYMPHEFLNGSNPQGKFRILGVVVAALKRV